jgi:hypothetical protein
MDQESRHIAESASELTMVSVAEDPLQDAVSKLEKKREKDITSARPVAS